MYSLDVNNKIKDTIEKYKYASFKPNGRSLEEGIDCLGFLVLFYKEFGIYLPDGDGEPVEKRWYVKDPERYVRGIKALGKQEIPIDQLQALDLIYFAVKRDVITHSGVMINDTEFVHMSPNRGVTIDSLKRHWRKFRGAIRLI